MYYQIAEKGIAELKKMIEDAELTAEWAYKKGAVGPLTRSAQYEAISISAIYELRQFFS